MLSCLFSDEMKLQTFSYRQAMMAILLFKIFANLLIMNLVLFVLSHASGYFSSIGNLPIYGSDTYKTEVCDFLQFTFDFKNTMPTEQKENSDTS